MTVSKFLTWWDYLQVTPQPPWWWKFELNNPRWKLSIRATLIAIWRYLEAKFDYRYFIIFLHNGSKILHKKSQVILTKNEGMTTIFPEFWFHFELGKSTSRLHFCSKWLEIFCVKSKNYNTKKLWNSHSQILPL